MKKQYLNLFLFLFIALASCTPYKDKNFFEGLDRNSEINHKIDNFAPLVIQPGDILSIFVRSLSPEGSALFNTGSGVGVLGGSPGGSSDASSGGSPSVASGWLVDKKGEVVLPLIHNIKVSGYTLEEIQAILQKAISPFLKEVIVTVHLLNFKITVLGDVSHSAVFSVNGDHVSITEALSMAGDITITGKRKTVLLIREFNGERKFANIDLTSNKLFESPYYYLKNNDILYVEASRDKFIPLNQAKQNLSIIFSVISLLLVVFSVNKANHIF